MNLTVLKRSAAALALGVVFFAACKKAVEYKAFANDSEVPRITVADAKKDFDAGNAVFVDSRAEPAYRSEHIAGAINVPYSTNSEVDKVPKGKKVIIYCS